MENLVESAYNTNNQIGITFIAHSMGGRNDFAIPSTKISNLER